MNLIYALISVRERLNFIAKTPFVASDAPKLLAAVAAANVGPRLSLLKESPFLPSLLSTTMPL